MAHEQGQVVAIVGPTGIGKTKLSISLALALGGEVVSVDSLQVYRDCKIMTAQATQEEMMGIEHHMIDYLDAFEEPVDYVPQALRAIRSIHSRGKVAILCGGSTSLTEPLLFHESVLPCRPLVIAMFAETEVLGKLTDTRIDNMMNEGLLEEVVDLRNQLDRAMLPSKTSVGVCKSIGYPELAPCLDLPSTEARSLALEDGIAKMKQNTRRYSSMHQNWIWTTLLRRVYKNNLQWLIFKVNGKATFRVDVEESAVDLSLRWLEMRRAEFVAAASYEAASYEAAYTTELAHTIELAPLGQIAL